MPLLTYNPEKIIKTENDSLIELRKKCKACSWLKGKVAENIATFKFLMEDYSTEDGPAILAFAQYGNTCAIYTPQYLKGEQWLILECFLDYIEEDDELIVFSKEVFERLREYRWRKLNVKLSI